jgi:hypothetical protein
MLQIGNSSSYMREELSPGDDILSHAREVVLQIGDSSSHVREVVL